jgi:hypothetical protein
MGSLLANRNFLGRPFGDDDRGRARRDDQVDLVFDQIRSKVRQTVEVAIGKKIFGFDRMALDVTELAHSQSILVEKPLPFRLCRRYQPADPREASGTPLS